MIEAHGVAESMCKKCLEEVELVSLLVSSSWRETYPTQVLVRRRTRAWHNELLPYIQRAFYSVMPLD